MSQKQGFTTGTQSGDLDAKFGASLQADTNWVSLFLLSFCGLQLFAFALALMLVVPLMLWGIAFFSAHPEFLGEQMAHLQLLFN